MARDELVLSDYLGVMLRRKYFIAAITLVVAILSFAWSRQEQIIYRSHALIKIQRQMNVAQMFDELVVGSGDPVENAIVEITSLTVVSNAAAALAFPKPPLAKDIADTRAAIRTERVRSTDLIDIYATGSTPVESQRRGDTVVAAFIEQHDKAVRQSAEDAFLFIQDAHDTLVKGLKDREQNLLEQLGPAHVGGSESEEIAALRKRLADLQLTLYELRNSGNFKEDYPGIVDIRSQSAQIEGLLKDKIKREFDRKRHVSEYERYQVVMNDIDSYFAKRIEEARIAAGKKNEIVRILEPPDEGIPTNTNRARKTIAGLLLGLMLGIILSFVADHLDTSIRNVVEIEDIFQLPVLGVIPHFSAFTAGDPSKRMTLWNRIKPYVPLTSATILLRAIRLSFAVRPDNMNDAPSAPTVKTSQQLVISSMPRSPAAEAYRTLRTNIQLHLRPDNNAVLITSASPAEGKTTTIVNLAMAFAQAGKKTLLVSGNMRRPQLFRVFGLDRERGLSDILVGDIPWRDTVKDYSDVALGEGGQGLATSPGMDNINFITCGGRTIHPAEWLAQSVLADVVKEWKASYDIVLIDAPPILPVPDSVILASVVRQMVLIYQVGVTARESIRRSISSIQNSGARILGIVLNDLKASRTDDAEFYHYRTYYGRQE